MVLKATLHSFPDSIMWHYVQVSLCLASRGSGGWTSPTSPHPATLCPMLQLSRGSTPGHCHATARLVDAYKLGPIVHESHMWYQCHKVVLCCNVQSVLQVAAARAVRCNALDTAVHLMNLGYMLCSLAIEMPPKVGSCIYAKVSRLAAAMLFGVCSEHVLHDLHGLMWCAAQCRLSRAEEACPAAPFKRPPAPAKPQAVSFDSLSTNSNDHNSDMDTDCSPAHQVGSYTEVFPVCPPLPVSA